MNNATFIGNLGKDAELKELDGGKKVINFSIAVPDGKDKTLWIDCANWSEKTAVLPYLLKGTKVAVTGNVGLRKWETGATITLRVIDLELLGGKAEAKGNNENIPVHSSLHTTNGGPGVIPEEKDDLPF